MLGRDRDLAEVEGAVVRPVRDQGHAVVLCEFRDRERVHVRLEDPVRACRWYPVQRVYIVRPQRYGPAERDVAVVRR